MGAQVQNAIDQAQETQRSLAAPVVVDQRLNPETGPQFRCMLMLMDPGQCHSSYATCKAPRIVRFFFRAESSFVESCDVAGVLAGVAQ